MSHQVTLQPSGRRFDADDGETLLAAALRAGIVMPYGCRNGACGSCKCRVISGALRQGPHAHSALSEAERAEGRALACCAFPQGDLVVEARELSGVGDIVAKRMPCRVLRIERAAPDVAIVTLQLPSGERLNYLAGQYLDLLLKDGTRRSYSIATPPHADEPVQLHIRHMPGGRFTDALFGVSEPPVRERDILRCEAPLGTFFLREESSRPIVLLAGGTGFAPIQSIARTIFHRGLNRGAAGAQPIPVRLYWGCRTATDLYLGDVPRHWAEEEPNFSYVPVLSEPRPGEGWSGRTGLVHHAVIEDLPDLSGHDVYACGAPAMVEAARRDFVSRCGLPEESYFADAFTSARELADDAAG